MRRDFGRLAGLLFGLVLCGILIFGLWPFGSPPNDVTWVPDQHAVRLGETGTILSTAPLAGWGSGACSVEMWLRPASANASSTLLAFYGERGSTGLSLHQSLRDLRLDNETSGWRKEQRYVNAIFRAGQVVFLTVTSEPTATMVYLDGSPVARLKGLRAPRLCSGRFVVGDSNKQNATWRGDIGGIAIYLHSLTADEALSDYQSWRRDGRPRGLPQALFLFDQNGGNTVSNRVAPGVTLIIPERYRVAQQILFETPWSAFQPTWDYAADVVINIAGFIPFGLTLSAFLASRGRTSGLFALTVILGLIVSLTIEALQANLPTRHSDLTDVITNTLGTGIGAIAHERYRLWSCSCRPVSVPQVE